MNQDNQNDAENKNKENVMTNREKVIKGLEYCMGGCQVSCFKCPYRDPGEVPPDCLDNCRILQDALKLLKEQEPRVLTWDEVKRVEVCWVEERGKEPYADLHATEWNPEYYCKEIRCWNNKPTKEQRKAVKWNDT